MKFILLMLGMLVVGCSGKGSSSTSSAAASAWPAKWCQAQPGITKEELVNIMGKPTSGAAKQMTWTDDHYRFYAFLEDDGTVEQLDINSVDLTAAEKAGLQCKTTRTKESMMAAQEAKRASSQHPACEIIPQARMSEILGSPVVAAADGRSKCVYTSSGERGPYAELSVEYGDGDAGMAGAGLAGSGQPGMVNPYEGIGDKAVGVGPMLMIKTGDDLVTIVLTNVKDRPATVRKIFDATKAAM